MLAFCAVAAGATGTVGVGVHAGFATTVLHVAEEGGLLCEWEGGGGGGGGLLCEWEGGGGGGGLLCECEGGGLLCECEWLVGLRDCHGFAEGG